jgi:hypothetical protein
MMLLMNTVMMLLMITLMMMMMMMMMMMTMMMMTMMMMMMSSAFVSLCVSPHTLPSGLRPPPVGVQNVQILCANSAEALIRKCEKIHEFV